MLWWGGCNDFLLLLYYTYKPFYMLMQSQIEDIKTQIVEKYKPERIILFGSAAWGKPNEDSDLDFLIIKNNVPYIGVDRMREVRRLVDTDAACDFIVAKPSEIKKRIKLGDPFVKKIINEGKVIYG